MNAQRGRPRVARAIFVFSARLLIGHRGRVTTYAQMGFEHGHQLDTIESPGIVRSQRDHGIAVPDGLVESFLELEEPFWRHFFARADHVAE